jgi:hypothetical protein
MQSILKVQQKSSDTARNWWQDSWLEAFLTRASVLEAGGILETLPL